MSLRILKMWLRNIRKKKEYIFCTFLGLYLGAVFWITLFSRIGSDSRNFLWPLYSYVQVVKGDYWFLLENIANVCLFVPIGVVLKSIEMEDIKGVVIVGGLLSLFVEIIQAVFSLGTFECDDIFHNTLGVVVGYCLTKRFFEDFRIKLNRKMKWIILLSMILFLMIPWGYEEIRHQKMARLAELHDKADGTKNLLVLNGKNGYAWDTEVYVEYLDDGSVHIEGISIEKTWKRIADIELEAGVYECFDLREYSNEKVKLYVAPYNEEKDDYILQLVKKKKGLFFELKEKTKVRVYVSIEMGSEEIIQLLPVIYKIS